MDHSAGIGDTARMTKRFTKRLAPLLALACTLPLAAGAAGTPEPAPFTATYQVLRKDSPLGTSTLELRHDGDRWVYTSALEAKSGLAALLGGGLSETSRFRIRNERIEALDYDYRMHTSLKSRERHMRVDWKDGTVSVDDGKKSHTYPTQPGLVERHLVVQALGRAVANGKTDITLPVGGKKRVKTQTYAVTGKETVEVPLGRIEAVHVKRTHDDKGFQVWFAPQRFGTAPVKLSQESGGDITLLLKSYGKP